MALNQKSTKRYRTPVILLPLQTDPGQAEANVIVLKMSILMALLLSNALKPTQAKHKIHQYLQNTRRNTFMTFHLPPLAISHEAFCIPEQIGIHQVLET